LRATVFGATVVRIRLMACTAGDRWVTSRWRHNMGAASSSRRHQLRSTSWKSGELVCYTYIYHHLHRNFKNADCRVWLWSRVWERGG